jgi:hypothetical protein
MRWISESLTYAVLVVKVWLNVGQLALLIMPPTALRAAGGSIGGAPPVSHDESAAELTAKQALLG